MKSKLRFLLTFFLVIIASFSLFSSDPEPLISTEACSTSSCGNAASRGEASLSCFLSDASYRAVLGACPHVTATYDANNNVWSIVLNCVFYCTSLYGGKHDGTGTGYYEQHYAFRYGFSQNVYGTMEAYAIDRIFQETGHGCSNHE